LETPRGLRIAKEKASHKIDVVVARAQAALGVVCGGQSHDRLKFWRLDAARRLVGQLGRSIEAAAEARGVTVEELAQFIESSESENTYQIVSGTIYQVVPVQSFEQHCAQSFHARMAWPAMVGVVAIESAMLKEAWPPEVQ
jgi:hypothetical protein